MSWVREKHAIADKGPDLYVVPAEKPSAPPLRVIESVKEVDALVLEHSKRENSRRRARRRRQLVFVMLIGLVLGTIIPLAIFSPLSRSQPTEADEVLNVNNIQPVRVSLAEGSTANVTVDLESLIPNPATVSMRSAPIDIAAYAEQLPITLQPRQYLPVRGSQRIYTPEIALETISTHGSNTKITVNDLRSVPGQAGRLKSSQNEIQWQSNWSYGNADENLHIGSQYTEYLGSVFDRSFSNKLSTVGETGTKILPQIERRHAGPSGSSR